MSERTIIYRSGDTVTYTPEVNQGVADDVVSLRDECPATDTNGYIAWLEAEVTRERQIRTRLRAGWTAHMEWLQRKCDANFKSLAQILAENADGR